MCLLDLYLDFNPETDPAHTIIHEPDPAPDRSLCPRPGPVRAPATDTAKNPEVTHADDQEEVSLLPAIDLDHGAVRDVAHDFVDCVCTANICISFFKPSRVANRALYRKREYVLGTPTTRSSSTAPTTMCVAPPPTTT